MAPAYKRNLTRTLSPILLPGGAVTPAMKAATGLAWLLEGRLCSFKYRAAFSSADPPISPIRTIPYSQRHYYQHTIIIVNLQWISPSVSGSFRNTSKQSTKFVPLKGSPPIPASIYYNNTEAHNRHNNITRSAL